MTQKTTQNPWTMDVRVRERNLKSGALTEKDLEKFLTSLPDVADQAEPFALSQPALAQSSAAAEDDVDEGDEGDEGDDDEGADEGDAGEAP